jgi:glycosyltransferase involved in cell wall biosynthesis
MLLAFDVLSVSGILPVKNGIKYLPDSIVGILKCLRSQDELIIIDDGSIDGTYDYIKRMTLEDPRLHLERNQGNGLVDALNFGISISSNQWLARFDIDDIYFSSRIDSQIAVAHPKIGAIFCDYEVVSDDLLSLGIIPTSKHPVAVALSLVQGNRTPHPGSLLNKNAVIEVGGYRQTEFPCEDLGLWVRMVKSGFEIISVPKVLLKYRIHSASVTSTRANSMVTVAEDIRNGDFVPGLFDQALVMAKQILSDYERESLSHERQLLLISDLILYWQKHSSRKIGNLIYIVHCAMGRVRLSTFKTLTELFAERIKRRKYRNS